MNDATKQTPWTERETRLLLAVFEIEADNARLLEEKWKSTPERGYEDGAEALAYEQAFAAGHAHGAAHALTMLINAING